MRTPDTNPPAESEKDLAKRLERYRRRVEAEGRKRSLRIIDRAIGDAVPADRAD
jgi:hypothetical protein